MLQSIASILKTPSHLLAHKFNYNKFIRLSAFDKSSHPSEIAQPLPGLLLSTDIKNLDTDELLLESGDMQVFIASTKKIPFIMQEIARLREITFREIGEGTGKAADIDKYDKYYKQLFLWNKKTLEVVGGYRLGLTDVILKSKGKKGLYSHSLFKINSEFFNAYPEAIELGRSFVRPEYQRSFSPLMLLWKGIMLFVYNNPKYCILYGPVSISNDYSPVSQNLLINFLQQNCSDAKLEKLIKARTPYKIKKDEKHSLSCMKNLALDEISTLISSLEEDNKGVPVLVKQYLKLNGTMLSFNRDSNFADCIDGFIRVDFREAGEKNLAKYMGKAQALQYMQRHDKTAVQTAG